MSYVVFGVFGKIVPILVLRHLQGRMAYAVYAVAITVSHTAAFTLQIGRNAVVLKCLSRSVSQRHGFCNWNYIIKLFIAT